MTERNLETKGTVTVTVTGHSSRSHYYFDSLLDVLDVTALNAEMM